MGNPPPEDKSRGYEIPIVFHDTAEFDMAADLGYKDTAPPGEFTYGEYIHHFTEFDCSQRAEEGGEVALRLTLPLPASEPSPALARHVSEILYALHEYDKVLGGKGLGLDRAASRSGGEWLSLVLRPNGQQGAINRFRRMAEQLGSPITDAPPEAPNNAASNGILADLASLWEQLGHQQENGATRTPDLIVPRERVRRYHVRFALVSHPRPA